MKIITQKDIADILSKKTATVSRYLTGKRSIKLSDALKVSEKFKVPVKIFIDSDLQIKHFGKTFLTTNESLSESEKKLKSTKRKNSTKEETC